MIYELFPRGKHCFIHDGWKVFNDKPDNQLWGDKPKENQHNMSVSLKDATKIQNICWMHNLAPRVYGVHQVQVGAHRYWAQFTEVVSGETSMDEAWEVYTKVKKLGEEYGFTNDKDDVSTYDVMGGKLVDFNTFHFTDDHQAKIKAKYIKTARYGKIYYHDIPEWGLTNSPRQNPERIKWLGLDRIDLEDRKFADLGCAGGYFVRYAEKQGARAIGYDCSNIGSENPIAACRLVANEFECWESDYIEMDLRTEKPAPADVVLFASMNFHVDIPKWLPEITQFLCIFEDNSKEHNALPELKKMFRKVEQVSVATDQDNCQKPIYWCWK